LVAHDAGVGGASGFIFVGKILDDVFLELGGFVDEVVGDVEFVADGAGVGDGLGAAAFIFGAVDAVLGPEFEGDANDVEALLDEQGGGGGGIDSAAHTTNDALVCIGLHRSDSIAEGGRV